jgi:hypothetical protein
MDWLNHPVVKVILIALAGANAAVLAYPGTPQTLKLICTGLAAVFPILGVGTGVVANTQLRRARAELLELKGKTP